MDNLLVDIVNQILALPTPSNFDGLDVVGWKGTDTQVYCPKCLQFTAGDFFSCWR